MSTFVLNPNDTLVLGDSVFAKVVKLSDVYQSVVIDAETNVCDWYIVATICGAIIFVAFIACHAVLSWKEKEIQANSGERDFKKEKEEIDAIRKQKSALLDKFLDSLKEGALKDDKWIQDYKEVLVGFKESLQKETTGTSGVNNIVIPETDKSQIVKILEKQMEFLKEKASISNAKAEKEYKQVLAYLIEMSQHNKMEEISRKDFLDMLKDDDTLNINPESDEGKAS